MNHGDVGIASAKHYEHEATFFREFLDPYLKYGSGYFEPGDDFERASVRMLDRAIDLATLPTDRVVRVLDVGSGWGSLHRRLRERLEERLEYHEINPSSVQRGYATEVVGRAHWTHAGGLESADLPNDAYDVVFLQDSFCHLADKAAMLKKLARSLRPDGRIVIQDTFFANEKLFERHRAARTTKFIQNDVFGFAEIIATDAFLRDMTEASLRLVLLEDVSHHYKQTVAAWLQRIEVLEPSRFPLRDSTARMLRYGAAGLGYAFFHHLVALAPHPMTLSSVKATLRALRDPGDPKR